MNFNLNDTVRVKLTDHGRKVHAADVAVFWDTARHPSPPQYKPPKEDADGWSEWQLWSLMHAFGQHIYMGCPLPFETTIQLVERKPYSPPAADPMQAVRDLCK